MPYLRLYPVGNSPIPLAQSPTDRRLDQRMYVVTIVPPQGIPEDEILASVTEYTGTTKLGIQSAIESGVDEGEGEKISLHLVCDDGNGETHHFPIDVQAAVVSTDDFPADYFEIGWDVLCEYFDVCDRTDSCITFKVKPEYARLCGPPVFA